MRQNKIVSSCLYKKARIRSQVLIPTAYGQCKFYTFKNLSDRQEHITLVYNDADKQVEPLVRLHSECITGEVFKSEKCDCGEQLKESMCIFSEIGGIILYLRQEGRGIGLYNKLDAYVLQTLGLDTFEANNMLSFQDDLRNYSVAAEMLFSMNVRNIKLVTNNLDKVNQLRHYGINVVDRVGTGIYMRACNKQYLFVKQVKSSHLFSNENNIVNFVKKSMLK